jgi:OOP family OmpA-OmpF porin
MRTKAVIAVLGLAGAAFALPAAAQSRAGDRSPALSSAYIGANIGQSKFRNACNGFTGCDDKDTSFRLFGGYQFTPNIAAELGYNDFGKIGGIDVKSNAWDLSAVGMWPLASQISLLGRVGLYHGEVKDGGSDTKNGVTFGLGAQYDFTRNVGVRAEWQRFNNISSNVDVDTFSIGALYRFQ